MKLVDYKNRKLTIGERVRIEEDIPSVNGMLYQGSIVKIDEFNEKNKTILSLKIDNQTLKINL